MYLLYIDESGDSGLKGSNHLLLSGAALFEGKWRWTRSELDRLLEQYFPTVADRPSELHCTEARRGRGPYSKLGAERRHQLLLDACQILDKLNGKEVALFSVVVDKKWWFARNAGRSGDDLYLEIFENLISRFDLFLRRRYAEGEPSKGIVIADPCSSALTKALKSAINRFHLSGTKWAQLHNVVETVLFLDSHESPGLQLADLAAYAVWRLVEAGDDTLAARLKYSFDREPVPGSNAKWHGIRFDGPQHSPARKALSRVWK